MRVAGLSASTLALVILVAGCSGDGGVPAATQTFAPAPVPTVDAATGAITGVVTDEEQVPLAGVDVGVVTTGAETQTDSAGKFTFNDLQPGTHTVIATRLGYEEGAARVTVVAGEVASVSLRLKAIVIKDEPYHSAVKKTAFFNVDSDLLAWLQYGFGINHSAINSLRCNPCSWVLHIAPGPEEVLTQVTWDTNPVPVFNNEMCGNYQKSWSDEMGGAQGNINGFCLLNKGTLRWTESMTKELKKIDKVRLLVDGGIIAVQWRIDVWTTFAYHGPLPDDYSALPPA